MTMVDRTYFYDKVQTSFMLRLSKDEVREACNAGKLDFVEIGDEVLFTREAIDNYRILTLPRSDMKYKLEKVK